MNELTINTAKTQSVIRCGRGAFSEYAPKLCGKQLFIITDSNVDRLYGGLMSSTFGEVPKFIIPAGEKSKNPKTLLAILKKMLACGIRRNGCVVAFGGGVVGDIAGLAAALYMRGVHLVQIPTTLLAQVDSSVGGKTAVDMDGVKNVIGTFYQPEEVVVDPIFLKTLPKRELRCGLGEIVKYGGLNTHIYKKLLNNKRKFYSPEFLEDITFDCISHKADLVEKDEQEISGLRKSLNLGHTTGHALELYYGKKSHGEFVLIGAYYELYIAVKRGICGGGYAESYKNIILTVLKAVPSYEDISRAAELAVHDKKNDDNLISIIVPVKEGEWTELKLEKDDYIKYLVDCSAELGVK